MGEGGWGVGQGGPRQERCRPTAGDDHGFDVDCFTLRTNPATCR